MRQVRCEVLRIAGGMADCPCSGKTPGEVFMLSEDAPPDHMCSRAYASLRPVAASMISDRSRRASDGSVRDVTCPDTYVTFRLSID